MKPINSILWMYDLGGKRKGWAPSETNGDCVCVCVSVGRSAAHRVLERYRARSQEQSGLNRGLSRSMSSLPVQDVLRADDSGLHYPPSEIHPGSESSAELYPHLQTHAASQPQLQQQQQQARGRPADPSRKPLSHRGEQRRKNWASAVDLACLDPEVLHWGGLEEARRGSSALSTRSAGARHRSASRTKEGRHSDFGGLQAARPHHLSAVSVNSALNSAYERIRERQRKLHALQQAMDGEYTYFSVSSFTPSTFTWT